MSLSDEELEKMAIQIAIEMGYVEHPENEQQTAVVQLILNGLRTVRDQSMEYRKILPYGGYCNNPACNTLSVQGSTSPKCSCGWAWGSREGKNPDFKHPTAAELQDALNEAFEGGRSSVMKMPSDDEVEIAAKNHADETLYDDNYAYVAHASFSHGVAWLRSRLEVQKK